MTENPETVIAENNLKTDQDTPGSDPRLSPPFLQAAWLTGSLLVGESVAHSERLPDNAGVHGIWMRTLCEKASRVKS